MCERTHVESTKEIPQNCFKIKSIAGAYWRGDSNNTMMTRIYCWAYETKEELDERVKAFQEAQKRDHKKLGKELNLFTIDEEVGKGLPLWLPNGMVLREEIEKLMKELEFKDGYQRVSTPSLSKTSLYHRTGHLPYYKEGMFPFMESGSGEEAESYALGPMTCPHHHKIFDSSIRSYQGASYSSC